ncbi:hypothetical protein R1CP_39835 (plasmid) [Rhodococcus opacus]|uniref:Uncharacterized protein n=1 Tax=Rhodococcus opacus TaxID=37919 RepID=A0A1B1KIY6_RHOOP|nr:hypothetical protein R1CP_39835 [Rhodococcus opacus]
MQRFQLGNNQIEDHTTSIVYLSSKCRCSTSGHESHRPRLRPTSASTLGPGLSCPSFVGFGGNTAPP